MVIPGLFFFIFVFSILLTVNVQYKFLPMTGFEPLTSRIGSNLSTNWATTTAHGKIFFYVQFWSDGEYHQFIGIKLKSNLVLVKATLFLSLDDTYFFVEASVAQREIFNDLINNRDKQVRTDSVWPYLAIFGHFVKKIESLSIFYALCTFS